MKKNVLSLAVFATVVLLPVFAFAQFGGLVPTKSFDTSKVDKLLDKADKVHTEYGEVTATLWDTTEIVQNLVDQFSEGEFPLLTNAWKGLKQAAQDKLKAAKEAGEKIEDELAFELDTLTKLRTDYFAEMVERKAAMAAILDDPAKAAEIKVQIPAPELEAVQSNAKDLEKFPTRQATMVKEIKTMTTDAASLVKELGEQAISNPLKAGDYKSLMGKLETATGKLTNIASELPKQVEAVETILGALKKLAP